MPLFDSRGLGPAVVVAELLAVVALVFAVAGHIERSSDAAFAEFMTANTSSASEPGSSHQVFSAAEQPDPKGKTGCPVGNKELPTRAHAFAVKIAPKPPPATSRPHHIGYVVCPNDRRSISFGTRVVIGFVDPQATQNSSFMSASPQIPAHFFSPNKARKSSNNRTPAR